MLEIGYLLEIHTMARFHSRLEFKVRPVRVVQGGDLEFSYYYRQNCLADITQQTTLLECIHAQHGSFNLSSITQECRKQVKLV